MRWKMEESKSKLPLTALIYFIVLFSVVIPICLGATSSYQDKMTYRMKYDANPLNFETAYVINRGTSYNGYESYEGFTLYEVILVCRNIGSFTAAPQRLIEFYTDAADRDSLQIYNLYLNYDDNYDFAGQIENTMAVPAGQRGSYRCMIEVESGADRLVIQKKGEPLDEQTQSEIIVMLPRKTGGEESWAVG